MQVMERVCGFLGVKFDPKYFAGVSEPVHVGKQMDIPRSLYQHLKRQLRPFYKKFIELYPQIGEEWGARHYKKGALS
jgi:hypothetical protein